MSLPRLRAIQSRIASCRDCPRVAGTPVHGAPVLTPVLLLGQAPGTHEAERGRPFAYTAGKTLFKWFNDLAGIDEDEFRSRVYMAAVARCFPGKALTADGRKSGGGDRVPDPSEIANCSRHLRDEIELLKPDLILAVGRLAIAQTLGPELFPPTTGKLSDVVGQVIRANFHGRACDVIALPHPSGLSAWPKTEPGKTLLKKALGLVGEHPAWQSAMELNGN